MVRVSSKVRLSVFLGAAMLAASAVVPHSAPRAATTGDGVGLFGSATGCVAAERSVGTDGLLARAKADAPAASARRRPAAKARSAQRPAARVATAPGSAGKAPHAEQETRPTLLRTLYTCSTNPAGNLTEGTGWRLVGPLRQS